MRSLAFFSVLSVGCVTPGAGTARVDFNAAMAEGHQHRASTPSLIDDALQTFTQASHPERHAAASGAPMPPAHVRAWEDVLAVLDAQLDVASALQLVRARLVLQSELDADIGTFGDVPPALALHLVQTLRQLSARLTALTSRPRQATPATFGWPTSPLVVTSAWGARVHPLSGTSRFHAGVDLAGEPGQEVRAAAEGTVVFAGWNGAHGKQVEVQHDGHLATRYSHLMTWLVEPGQQVRRGEVLGLLGQTGQVTGPHLHFELRRDGDAIDPEQALPPAPLAGR